MTEPAPVDLREAPAPMSTMAEDLARITREAARLAELLNEVRADGLSSQQTFLLRLVTGHGEVDGDESVGWPIDGGRLAFARSTGHLSLPTASTEGRTAFVAAPIRTGSLIALVRGVPRSAEDGSGRRHVLVVDAALRSQDPRIIVGVSSPLRSAGTLAEAYREAVDAADLAEQTGTMLAFADERWADLALLRVRRGFRHTLPVANPVARLHAHDRSKGSDLAHTVLTWLATNCEVSATAATMRLHPNTLRYRLRKAADVGGFDLASPEHRMLLHLGLGASCAVPGQTKGPASPPGPSSFR